MVAADSSLKYGLVAVDQLVVVGVVTVVVGLDVSVDVDRVDGVEIDSVGRTFRRPFVQPTT